MKIEWTKLPINIHLDKDINLQQQKRPKSATTSEQVAEIQENDPYDFDLVIKNKRPQSSEAETHHATGDNTETCGSNSCYCSNTCSCMTGCTCGMVCRDSF